MELRRIPRIKDLDQRAEELKKWIGNLKTKEEVLQKIADNCKDLGDIESDLFSILVDLGKIGSEWGIESTSKNGLVKTPTKIYDELYDYLDDYCKGKVFPFISPEKQTPEGLLLYFGANMENASLKEWKREESPGTKVIIQLIDRVNVNLGRVVFYIKDDWWDKRLANRVLKIGGARAVVPPKFWINDEDQVEQLEEEIENHGFVQVLKLFKNKDFLKKKGKSKANKKLREIFLRHLRDGYAEFHKIKLFELLDCEAINEIFTLKDNVGLGRIVYDTVDYFIEDTECDVTEAIEEIFEKDPFLTFKISTVNGNQSREALAKKVIDQAVNNGFRQANRIHCQMFFRDIAVDVLEKMDSNKVAKILKDYQFPFSTIESITFDYPKGLKGFFKKFPKVANNLIELGDKTFFSRAETFKVAKGVKISTEALFQLMDLLPLPPFRTRMKQIDFEDAVKTYREFRDYVKEQVQKNHKYIDTSAIKYLYEEFFPEYFGKEVIEILKENEFIQTQEELDDLLAILLI